MQKQDWPYIIACALGLAIASGSASYMIAGGSAPLMAIVIAVLSLVASQIVAFVFISRRTTSTNSHLHELGDDVVRTMRKVNDSQSPVETIRVKLDEFKHDQNRDRETVSRGFSELKESYASLLDEMRRTSYVHAQQQDYGSQPVFTSPQEAEFFEPPQQEPLTETEAVSPFGDQLAVSLEPIIDLSTGRTAHYRMHLGLTTEQGNDLSPEFFLHHADRIGARPALDMFVAREAEVLLRKLRQRDPQLSIFMPIGASTLATPQTIAQMNADRKAAPDVATGLVFELPHAMLAGLTDQALEGLASLARSGARFALSNVSIAGLDLASMNTLNVRFVGLDASAIDATNGPTLAMASFTQTARASRVQMIVTAVSDQRIISKLPQITRLVCGPCFAPPRRVKKDAGENASAEFHVAA